MCRLKVRRTNEGRGLLRLRTVPYWVDAVLVLRTSFSRPNTPFSFLLLPFSPQPRKRSRDPRVSSHLVLCNTIVSCPLGHTKQEKRVKAGPGLRNTR